MSYVGMADPDRPSSSSEQPAHSHLRLLRLSHHALVPAQPFPDKISSPPPTWSGRILSGIGWLWGNQKQSTGVHPSQNMVLSAAGNDVAILDWYQITFLSSVDGFGHAVQSSMGPTEAGFYTCGVWLEDSGLLAAMTSLNCMILLDRSGKEVSRVSLGWQKSGVHPLAMFAKGIQNSVNGERYVLVVITSDCSIFQVEIGREGFGRLGSEAISHAIMKKTHPQEVMCYVYNCSNSILALAGPSGNKSSRSAGPFCISLWRVKDFWRSVELLGYLEDIENEHSSLGMSPSKGSCNLSPRLVMSPSCSYIGLLDCETRFHLVKVKQHPDGKLEKLNFPVGVKGEIGNNGKLQVAPKPKFPYLEVVSSAGMRNGTDFEKSWDIEDACWWDDNTLFLMKASGVLDIVSVPELRAVSEFHTGVVCAGMHITYGLQRCIYVLENLLDKPEDGTIRASTVVESRRGGWRLLRMEENTVSQLFNTLLENADFDFALELANRYNLEIDHVYKTQWLLSDWSLKLVQEVLSKVKDKAWVLKECLERVCPSLEAMDGLLRHGLNVVDLAVGPMQLKNAAQDPAVGRMCLTRLRLLQYSDRLETYLGLSMDRYTSKDYEVFRASSLVDVAVSLAETGKTGAVSLLYKRHIYSLTPFLFKILDALPETLPPHNYAHLLPSLVPLTPYIAGRGRDWVEEETIMDVINRYDVKSEEVSAVHLTCSTEYMVKASVGFVWPSELEILEWYKKRASAIDKVSGQVENSLTLLDLGKQKGVSGLEELWEDLSSLHWVIYNNLDVDERVEMNWSLEGWQKLTDYEKFQAMLKGVNESNVLDRLNEKAVPFMNQKMRRIPGDCQDQELLFLRKWILEIATKNQLNICSVILTEACKDLSSNRLFKSALECINTGLDCVYTCSALDQWDTMETILSKLSQGCSQLHPSSVEDQSSSLKNVGKGASRVVPFSMYSRSVEHTSKSDAGGASGNESIYAAVGKKIQTAMGHVDAGRLLYNYQVPKPIKFLENAQNDERAVKLLILSMLSKFARRQPSRSDAEWATLWDHLQRLQAKAFTFLNRQFLFMEYYSSLLKAGKFSLAKSQLKALGNNLVSPEKVETVILQVSRDYLFSASSLDSMEIEKARLCLSLVPESKSIASELDYIDTVTIKLPALGVYMLPMQVKQTKDPMEIVRKALISSSSQGDLQVDEVLDLSRSLGLNSEDQIDEVKEAIARQAAASGQIGLALHLCLGLIRRGHRAVWELCAALARGPELEEINLQLRKELLGFAISHCDDSSISQLLLTWKELDLSDRCINVKEALKGNFYDSDASQEESSLQADLQQQDSLLSKVAHLDGDFSSKAQKSLLRILCTYLPWLLQVADVNFNEFGNWQYDDTDLFTKSIATMLLGLAHSNLHARDELIFHLVHASLSRFTNKEDLVGFGYLLNLADGSRATDFLENETHNEKDLQKTCKILSFALKYGSLLQENWVGGNESPSVRRERLLALLRESDRCAVSGIIAEEFPGQINQWQTKILKVLDSAQHSLELAPFVANFNLESFMSGDQKYVEDVVKSLLKSSITQESLELEQTSRVDRYQRSNLTLSCTEESAQNHSLNLLVLERRFKIFERYLKYLDAMDRWVAIHTLMSVTAKAVLEETGKGYEDEYMKRLCSLVHFWIIVLDSFGDEDPSNAISSQAKKALQQLKLCCESYERLMLNKVISGSICREVIAKVVDVPSFDQERLRFLNAMVSSGCAFQTVLRVWQYVTDNSKGQVDRNESSTEISAIYVQVVSSSIKKCSALSQSVSFEECFPQLDPVLKAVASLSRDVECNDESLEEQEILSLHEVRLCVWKTICGFAENLDIPSPLRVCLLNLREAIISGHQHKTASPGFDDHLRKFNIIWVGWQLIGLSGEKTPPLQHTIMALKSTELLSTAWQDLIINADDLVSVDAATAVFNELTTRVEHAQHACLLTRLLEEWGDIFGWEGNVDEENPPTQLLMKEEVEHADSGWGYGDGWDDVWDESEEVIESRKLGKRDSGSVNALHACWKTALAKLASFKEMELLLRSLDRAHLRNGRTVLTREEGLELITRIAKEDSASALKVSLLLPYEDCQDWALVCFDSKIRATIGRREGSISGKEDDDEQAVAVDECLLVLVLGAGRFSTWVEDGKFAALLWVLFGLLSSMIQTGQFSSAFIQYTVFPYFVASLTSTSKYKVASALALQSMRVHPAFITWNGAYVALQKFLKVKASLPFQESKASSVKLESLSCITNSVNYLQSHLQGTLDSTLQFLSNASF